jgi:hypothetical protein
MFRNMFLAKAEYNYTSNYDSFTKQEVRAVQK